MSTTRGRKARFVALAATLSLAILIPVVGASPASAATVNLTTDCSSPLNLYGSPGDTVVIRMTSACDATNRWYIWDLNGSAADGADTASGFLDYVSSTNTGSAGSSDYYDDDWWVRSDGSGDTTVTATLRATDGDGAPLAVGSVVSLVYVDWSVGGNADFGIVYAGIGADDAPPPPSWYQSVGRASAGAVCEDGWHASWELWANSGAGGYVCSRELYYDRGSSSWAYRTGTSKR